jgi:polyene glycosyltransferase
MNAWQKIVNVVFRIGVISYLVRPAQLRSAKSIKQRRAADGVASGPGSFGGTDAAHAILGCTVFGLEYPFPKAPDHLSMLGAMIPSELGDTPADDELSRWLAEHDSVVYIGFGTIMRPTRGHVQAILDVSARLAPTHHVLWKLPRKQHDLLPPRSELPANLRIEEWVPSQLRVLAHPHVRAFFNHGGGNAVHEGLYFGKPLLIMPFWLDCYDYAVRAVDSGAALTVDNTDHPDPAEIAEKLVRLLTEDGFRTRARYWADRQRAAGGVSAAVDIIVAALDKKP